MTALSVPAFVAVTPAVGGAVPACDSSMAPVADGAQSTVTVGCVTVSADLQSNPVVYDYSTARWHQGAIREFTACTWTAATPYTAAVYPTNYQVTCGIAQGPAGSASDINHSATGGVASLATPTLPASADGIAGRSFIVAQGHSGANSWTLSQAFTKSKAGTGKFWIDNTTARSVGGCSSGTIPSCDAGLNTTNASTAVTASNSVGSPDQLAGVPAANIANFTAGDVGASISGECIQPGTTITAVGSTTSATMSAAADCTSSNRPGTINGDVDSASSARIITDGAWLAADPTLTSATANFSAADVGMYVKGTGIPANAYIASINSASSVELSAAPTVGTKDPVATTILGTANGVVQIGRPSLTAPKDGDKVSSLKTIIKLTPAFVPGSRDCAANEPSGFTLAGWWYNPGKFQKITFLGSTVPDVSNAVGQIVYKTSVTTFAGYVVRDALGLYRVEFPLVPTSLANCAGGDVAAGYSFDGSSTSQGLLGTGVGRPGTAVVRGIDTLGASTPTYNNFQYVNETYNVDKGGATGGTYTLNVAHCGGVTATIKATEAVANNVTKALRLVNSGGGYPCKLNVTATAAFNGWDITFSGAFKGVNVTDMTLGTDSTTGGTGVVVTKVGGVDGSTNSTLTDTGTSCTVTDPATVGFPCGLG